MQYGVPGPYTVRIYNLFNQAQDHYPTGGFISQWIPELKNIPNMWIHEPWKMNIAMQEKSKCLIGKNYPFPIVEHTLAVKEARLKIAEVYKKVDFRDG